MRRIVLAAIAALAMPLAAHAGPTAGPEASRALYDEIAKADAELFDALFNKCDVDRLGEIVADDIEFIHDKHGRTAGSKKEFIDSIRGVCARQASGEDYRARRELVVESQQVLPIEADTADGRL